MNLPKKLVIILVAFILIAWGLGFGYLVGHSVGGSGGSGLWGEVNSCLSEKEIKDILGDTYTCDRELSEYYSERFVFAGYSESGEPIVAEISLVRNESFPGVFSHSYTAYLVYEEEIYEESEYHNSSSNEVEPTGEELLFTHIPSEDLSTREDFVIEWQIDNIEFRAATSGFAGDFIVENSPQYTKYVSVGEAALEIAGETIKVDAMHTAIYSTDSSKYIFFDGYDDLSLEAYQLVWWDKEHNFYLVDKSDVKSNHEGYKSHSWLLYKDSSGFTQKAFDLEGLNQGQISEALGWNFNLPLYSISSSLQSGKFIENRGKKGLITGDVARGNDPASKLDAVGTFTYYDF